MAQFRVTPICESPRSRSRMTFLAPTGTNREIVIELDVAALRVRKLSASEFPHRIDAIGA